MCQEYNGWANYETWIVETWATNDEGTFAHYTETMQEIWLSQEYDRHQTAQEFSDWLKAQHEEGSPVREDASVYADLMTAALDTVDWWELAHTWLTDMLSERERELTQEIAKVKHHLNHLSPRQLSLGIDDADDDYLAYLEQELGKVREEESDE